MNGDRPRGSDRLTQASDGHQPGTDAAGTHRLWFLLGLVVVVALRLVVIRRSPFPNIIADETAYLSMARELSGRGGWNLGRAQTYGPAYSVLLAPWYALDLEAATIYRAAQLTNVALGAGLFIALESLVRRLTFLTRPLSVAVAALAASLPALALTGNYAWSDNAAPLAFALVCTAVIDLVQRPRLSRLVIAGAAMIGAHTVHGRFTPLLLALFGIVVVLVVTDRLPVLDAVIGCVAIVVGFVVVSRLTGLLYGSLYEPGGQVRQTTGTDLERLTRPALLLRTAAGQIWYLLATTAGLVGFGILAFGRGLVHRLRSRGGQPDASSGDVVRSDSLTLRCVAALISIEFLVSVGFMTDRTRSDNLIYGRYNDAFACLLAAVGLSALLWQSPTVRRVLEAGAIAATMTFGAVVLVTFEADKLGQTFFIKTTIQGLTPISEDGPRRLYFVTAVALVMLGAMATASLLGPPRRLGPAVRNVSLCGLTLALTLVGLQRGAARIGDDAPEDPRHVAYLTTLVRPGEKVVFPSSKDAYTRDLADLKAFYVYPFQEPTLELIRSFAPTSKIRAPLVLAPTDDIGLPGSGYRLAWVNPRSVLGLWVAPGRRQDQLARQHRLLPPTGLLTVTSPESQLDLTSTLRLSRHRLTGAVRIHRATDEPWAATGPGGGQKGRVRLSVVLVPVGCSCPSIELRQDFDDWIPAARSVVDLDLDVSTPRLNHTAYRVELQVLRENVERMGETRCEVVQVDR